MLSESMGQSFDTANDLKSGASWNFCNNSITRFYRLASNSIALATLTVPVWS
jgi:hypothetical protein